jgi:ATP-dependent Lhr-like helicase
LTRVVPIALVLREDLAWLLPPQRPPVEGLARANARRVLDVLATRGALFPAELASHAHLLPAQLDDALGELAALGAITADGFAAVRGIVAPDRKRVQEARRRLLRARGRAARPLARGGRGPLVPGGAGEVPDDERAERWAWQLIERYGVMFRDLLARESVAPPWRALLPVYRRLEARGEVRGGRFVAGVAGEQFAASETVDRLRRVRDGGLDEARTLVLSAAEPANLAGILTPGPRVPATRTNRLLVRAGRVIASLAGAKVVLHESAPPAQVESMGELLRRGPAPGGLPRPAGTSPKASPPPPAS